MSNQTREPATCPVCGLSGPTTSVQCHFAAAHVPRGSEVTLAGVPPAEWGAVAIPVYRDDADDEPSDTPRSE